MIRKALWHAEILCRGHVPFPLRRTMVGGIVACVRPFHEAQLWVQATYVLNHAGKGKSTLTATGHDATRRIKGL